VEFVFSDESGAKQRPALVISSPTFQGGRDEIVVAAITSNVTHLLVGDHAVVDWQESGLLSPSTVTGIIRTIKRQMVRRKLGSLSARDMRAVDRLLRQSLDL
jgi:mRNA-degrading endonuclease toxin of MazEF toxin-antitoxin module